VVHLSVETTALFKTVARTAEVDNIVCMFSYQMAERYLYTAWETVSYQNQSNMWQYRESLELGL